MPRFRFGVFEFDATNAELRREGSPVRLQSQPAQALGILLSSAGQTVSREDLRRAIWDSETFVDFERGLNFCIAQIRSALRDSADSPRYIRTIPRKGYQFIPPVTVLPDTSVAAGADLAPPPPDSPPVSHTTAWSRRLLVLAPVAIVVLGALLVLFIFEHRDKAPASKRVAVFRLDNATGDPQYQLLADIITDSLVAELTESGATSGKPGYSVIGNDTELRRPRSQRDLLAIGKRLRTPVTISGSIRRVAAPAQGNSAVVEIFVQVITLPDQQHRKVLRVPLPPNALSVPPSDVPSRIADALDPAIRSAHMSL